jgi:hypothetical protein
MGRLKPESGLNENELDTQQSATHPLLQVCNGRSRPER